MKKHADLRKPARPPQNYEKKIFGRCDCPLTETYTPEQVRRKIAFYQELNEKRNSLEEAAPIEKKFALYGWDDTTTVRVYMREAISKIAAELLMSNYTLSVENINRKTSDGKVDKDHGYVTVSIKAAPDEISALLEYIKPGSSYYVYDGEESKYIEGNTAESEFIIVKIDDPKQPKNFWRRNQSFVARTDKLA
ncbi:MAG: hypothetical protein HZB67_02100 [Candidatus Aenigmarchaeota archaeon]|nr:hypothetical protein [Candidatus Aenigmarchaeota archaeon]